MNANPVARRVRRTCFRLLAVAVVGTFVAWIVSIFAFTGSDAYGRVNIPGQTVVHLPQGEVDVAFDTQLATSGGNSGGLTVPSLSLSVAPAAGGGPNPTLTQDFGSTTTVNADAHIRVWRMQVPHAGEYRVQASGNVSAYIAPQLEFGHGSLALTVLEIGGIVIGVLVLTALAANAVLRRSEPRPPAAAATVSTSALGARLPGLAGTGIPGADRQPSFGEEHASPSEPDPARRDQLSKLASTLASVQSDSSGSGDRESARLDQLSKLAALHDRGAINDEEYAAEKARILKS